jgi:hypothetical protein
VSTLFYFIDIRAPGHALTHAFPLFELPAQTKTIQGVIRNLSAMNLASQAVRQATNEASLKMAKALLRFVDSDDLLAKRSEIDGCIDLELSVTALGRTIDTTAQGFMLAVKRKVDVFVKEDRVFLPVRTSLEHMRAAAKAVLEFALAANLYSRKLRSKTEEDLRAPLVVALNCVGLSCDNGFRKHILAPVYHGALTTNPVLGLNLFKFCRLPGIDISFFYPTPSAASGAAHSVFSPCTPPPPPPLLKSLQIPQSPQSPPIYPYSFIWSCIPTLVCNLSLSPVHQVVHRPQLLDENLDFDNLKPLFNVFYDDTHAKYPFGTRKRPLGSFGCRIYAVTTPLCVRGIRYEYSSNVGAPSKECFESWQLAQLCTLRLIHFK